MNNKTSTPFRFNHPQHREASNPGKASDSIGKSMNSSGLTKEEIGQWLKEYGVENWTINHDLSVDVRGSVYLDHCFRPQNKNEWLEQMAGYEEHTDHENREELKLCDDGTYERRGSYFAFEEKRFKPYTLPVRFNKVSGDFCISQNRLASLKGCPKEVGGDFDCEHSGITSLEGAPSKIGGIFNCSENNVSTVGQIDTLVGKSFVGLYGIREFKDVMPNDFNRINVPAATFNQATLPTREKNLLEATVARKPVRIDLAALGNEAAYNQAKKEKALTQTKSNTFKI
ncbi:hypothetical protein [Variovorax sp. W2I14]|uniref:hypothetical protein n=1 Tax=Variovorax sp. W2I14 TaxID=3042290 RepID=UPI003D1C8CB9